MSDLDVTEHPTDFAMKAAVELEIASSLGRVKTVVIGRLVQLAIDEATANLRKENEDLRSADRDHLAAKNGMEKRLNDEIERLRNQLVRAKRDAIQECGIIAGANYSLMFTKAEHREVARKVSGLITEQIRRRLPALSDDQWG